MQTRLEKYCLNKKGILKTNAVKCKLKISYNFFGPKQCNVTLHQAKIGKHKCGQPYLCLLIFVWWKVVRYYSYERIQRNFRVERSIKDISEFFRFKIIRKYKIQKHPRRRIWYLKVRKGDFLRRTRENHWFTYICYSFLNDIGYWRELATLRCRII